MIKAVGAVVAIFIIGIATAPTALAAPPPKPIIECPNSNTHVWDRDQCESFDLGKGRGGGGGGNCSGVLCGVLGGILDRIPGVGGLL